MKKRVNKGRVIVVAGSSSGGHVTPINGVLEQLSKRLGSSTRLVFVGQKGDKFAKLIDGKLVSKKYFIHSGKFRWYNGEGLRQILDIKTVLLNIRDFFLVIAGILQADRKLGKLKPDVIFIKGGSVAVPLGLAAAGRKIPIITHDSDAVASRSSRMISRWVIHHLVAMDPTNYPYPSEDTQQVGIPVAKVFFGANKNNKILTSEGLDLEKPTILVMGGSQGASKLNKIVRKNLSALLKQAQIIHSVGELNKDIDKKEDYVVKSFIEHAKIPDYIASSDLVITRAGATAITEVAAIGKPMILIPGKQLASDHQTYNAKAYEKAGAAIRLDEDETLFNPDMFLENIIKVLGDDKFRQDMVVAQASLVQRESADIIASIIASTFKEKIDD